MVEMHQPRLRGKASYVPVGINLTNLPVTRPERPRSPLRFGFFAGFQPNKGIWDVLDAAAALSRDGLEFELHIWGPHHQQAAAELAARGLTERVHINGMYAADALWQPYLEVDVAVMATTVCEPFGRIPLEARAVGVPTIAPDIGGLRESIRHGVDGLLYRFRDPAALERQMRRILTEPGLFQQLATELPPVIDTRTRGVTLERIYRSLISERTPA
jgi:glycosyltransferase involved in cell wall biosynthesis